MSKQNKIILVLIVVAVVIGGLYLANRYWIAPVTAARPQASSGKYPAAPDFSVTDIFGQKLSLADYRGKVVLLDFWATWCGPCRVEIPGFIQLQREYGPQGFQVIGISMDDDVQPVREFYKQFGMNYRVAMGGDTKISELYGGIIGLPTTFLIGRDGRIYDKVPGAVDTERFATEIKTLLAASPGQAAKNFQPAGASGNIEVETPAEANSPVPGVDVSKLSKVELQRYKDQLSKQNCDCGCKFNVLQCRTNDPSCGVSRELAKSQLEKFQKANSRI
jgi:thiol-disulfide isomerase/thioredoxin